MRRFIERRGWHELAHSWYEGNTLHSCGVCKSHCTLDPWDYQGVILPIGNSLLTCRIILSVCVRIFRYPCTREIHKSGLLLGHFYINSTRIVSFLCQKMNHHSYYRLNFQGVLLTAGLNSIFPWLPCPRIGSSASTDSSLRSYLCPSMVHEVLHALLASYCSNSFSVLLARFVLQQQKSCYCLLWYWVRAWIQNKDRFSQSYSLSPFLTRKESFWCGYLRFRGHLVGDRA